MTLDDAEVESLLDGFEKETRALKDDALRMAWYMRGGLSYDDAMMLNQNEREIINNLIKENLEVTKKSNMPFF